MGRGLRVTIQYRFFVEGVYHLAAAQQERESRVCGGGGGEGAVIAMRTPIFVNYEDNDVLLRINMY